MRIVIKCGSSLLTGPAGGLSTEFLSEICAQVAGLMAGGHQLVLVTSGAVAMGAGIVGQRPPEQERTRERQVLAAIGQSPLMTAYSQELARFNLLAAQALLSRSDLERRSGYLNARNTCLTLLSMGVLPVINENDVVATEEIRFGDNDRLSALAANLVDADLLVILTDVEGFFARSQDSDWELQSDVEEITEQMYEAAGGASGNHSIGGMRSKLDAARLALAHGTTVVIASGRRRDVLPRLVAGEPLGTRFKAEPRRMRSRQRWMLAEPTLLGSVEIDDGAVRALRAGRSSLLPAGVTGSKGRFGRGDLVSIRDAAGSEVARGLIAYGIEDLAQIAGQSSDAISQVLGYDYGAEVVHRNNMVVLE